MSVFLDKNHLTNHINSDSLKIKLTRSLDMVDSVLRNYEIKHTKFMDPFECSSLVSILKGIDGISFHESGGYEESERKIVYIYPDYFKPEDIQSVISMIRITGNFKYRDVGHRDYLGSILSLGINRENIGDICINTDGVYVVILENFKDYILFNLEKIANVRIQKSEYDIDAFLYEEPEYSEHSYSVSSIRIDSILSSGFDISREKAQNLIKNENVRVNHEVISVSSKIPKEGSVISVKGYGRIIFAGEICVTKKNKIRIMIKKYRK